MREVSLMNNSFGYFVFCSQGFFMAIVLGSLGISRLDRH